MLLWEQPAGRPGSIGRYRDLEAVHPSVAFLSVEGLRRPDEIAEDLDIEVVRP